MATQKENPPARANLPPPTDPCRLLKELVAGAYDHHPKEVPFECRIPFPDGTQVIIQIIPPEKG